MRDAAYHGKPLLVTGTTVTTRLPVNAALYAPAPPRTGRRGRPRRKGHRLGTPAEIAATAAWRPARVHRYGRTDTVETAEVPSIWYGPFGNTAGRTVLARDPGDTRILAIVTTDTASAPEAIVGRYAHRWSIETAIAAGKQQVGIGQTRNRLQRAVERAAPFQFIVYSLVVVWYALNGYHRDDLAARIADQPWYTHKAEPTFDGHARQTPQNPCRSLIRRWSVSCGNAPPRDRCRGARWGSGIGGRPRPGSVPRGQFE